MKLTIEIIDNKFKYSFEVGETSHGGEQPINPDALIIFTETMRLCVRAHGNDQDRRIKELVEKIVTEKGRKE